MGCSVPVVTYCVFKILLWCLNLLPALRGVKQAYIFNDCGGGEWCFPLPKCESE